MVQIASSHLMQDMEYSAADTARTVRAGFRLASGPAHPPQVLTSRRRVRLKALEQTDDSGWAERGPVDWNRIQSRATSDQSARVSISGGGAG